MQQVAIQNSLNAASRPARLQRIALINPTKFLGNLLLNGQYIQHLAQWCHAQDSQMLVVLDSRFQQLFGPAFASDNVKLCYYPRQALKQGRVSWQGVRQWWQCLSEIRRFDADLAFTIEEDSVAHRLTHLSGAKVRVSCSEARYHFGFDAILNIKRQGRSAATPSIWHVTGDIFACLGLPIPETISYPKLQLGTEQYSFGGDASRQAVVMHASASKCYKQWPVENFVALAKSIVSEGYQLNLVGAGPVDAQINSQIIEAVGSSGCRNFCDQLSLIDLARVIRQAHFMIGNDSGPSHLGSALGIPGVVLFGPTDIGLWKPLGVQTSVLHHKELCQSDCTRHHCRKGYACLNEITAQEVMARLKAQTDKS